MPPPRAKLHKNTGKSRSAPPTSVQQNHNNTEPEPSTSSGPVIHLTPEQEQQFEAELYWCIQQLQTALTSNKLNKKQIQDHTKALNTLMSNTAPLIKKRQVMRLSFGDYRVKMAAEEIKAKKLTITVTPSKPSTKSVFLKKAIIMPSENNFKFNFPNPDTQEEIMSNGNSQNMETERTIPDENEIKNQVFMRSDNSFKFNFSVNECDSEQKNS